jgi:hypothetical protein
MQEQQTPPDHGPDRGGIRPTAGLAQGSRVRAIAPALGSGAHIESWLRERRGDARILHEYGDTRGAGIVQTLLDSLEEFIRELDGDLLNLTQAAQVCGYSTDQLRRLIRGGKLGDYGRPGAPRLRPSELPRKAGPLPSEHLPLQLGGAERRQTARSIVNSIK